MEGQSIVRRMVQKFEQKNAVVDQSTRLGDAHSKSGWAVAKNVSENKKLPTNGNDAPQVALLPSSKALEGERPIDHVAESVQECAGYVSDYEEEWDEPDDSCDDESGCETVAETHSTPAQDLRSDSSGLKQGHFEASAPVQAQPQTPHIRPTPTQQETSPRPALSPPPQRPAQSSATSFPRDLLPMSHPPPAPPTEPVRPLPPLPPEPHRLAPPPPQTFQPPPLPLSVPPPRRPSVPPPPDFSPPPPPPLPSNPPPVGSPPPLPPTRPPGRTNPALRSLPVPPSLALDGEPWFHRVDRAGAHALLHRCGDGAFLVRPSRGGGSEAPLALTLVHVDRDYHFIIRLRSDGRFALGAAKRDEYSFASVQALVKHYQTELIALSRGQATRLAWHPAAGGSLPDVVPYHH